MKLKAIIKTYLTDDCGTILTDDCGTIKRITAKGDNKIDCLKKLVEHIYLGGLEPSDIDKRIERDGSTFEDIIESIKVCNDDGNGCDHIISLIDDIGNIYIQDEEDKEEIY